MQKSAKKRFVTNRGEPNAVRHFSLYLGTHLQSKRGGKNVVKILQNPIPQGVIRIEKGILGGKCNTTERDERQTERGKVTPSDETIAAPTQSISRTDAEAGRRIRKRLTSRFVLNAAERQTEKRTHIKRRPLSRFVLRERDTRYHCPLKRVGLPLPLSGAGATCLTFTESRPVRLPIESESIDLEPRALY